MRTQDPILKRVIERVAKNNKHTNDEKVKAVVGNLLDYTAYAISNQLYSKIVLDRFGSFVYKPVKNTPFGKRNAERKFKRRTKSFHDDDYGYVDAFNKAANNNVIKQHNMTWFKDLYKKKKILDFINNNIEKKEIIDKITSYSPTFIKDLKNHCSYAVYKKFKQYGWYRGGKVNMGEWNDVFMYSESEKNLNEFLQILINQTN